jgi:hypothetical protein
VENAFADGLHWYAKVKGWANTDPHTAGYGDLFVAWLFELGPQEWRFGPNDRTTQFLKTHEGAERARQSIRAQRAAGVAFPKYDRQWTYDTGQYWKSLTTLDPTLFLGSYQVKATVTPDRPNEIQFEIRNRSGWESGTRLLGNDQAIIPDRRRDGQGIHLGGNMEQVWRWSEPLQ